jgi:hypothetical protein
MSVAAQVVQNWTPTKLLRATREKLNHGNGEHWAKGAAKGVYNWLDRKPKDKAPAYCLLGGVTEVFNGESRDYNIPKDAQPAVLALANAIRAEKGQKPCASIQTAQSTIIGYNDDSETTWKQISAALGRAAARPAHYIEQSSVALQRKIGWK